MSKLSGLEPIAITGATGFIGKHLVRTLVEGGRRPILLTRLKNDEAVSLHSAELQTRKVDLTDFSSVEGAIYDIRPSTLFHLAGTRGRGWAGDASAVCMELNFTATVGLLEAAMGAGVQRIVIVGTAEEYGNQPGPQRESLPARATSPYGISKAKATEYAVRMHAETGCPVVIVRPFSVYGPGQPGDMFVAEAVDSAVRNVEFRMSRGEQGRDLIFVDDVERGLIAAAGAPGVEGSVINLGSGECHPLRDVAQWIWRLTDTNAPLLIGARVAGQEELHDTWADITLAKRLLEWEPRVGLETGLRRAVDFARDEIATSSQAQTCKVM